METITSAPLRSPRPGGAQPHLPVWLAPNKEEKTTYKINDESLSFGKVDWHQVVSRQRLGAGFNSSLKICGHLRPSAV
jgi:hypothetical protein